MPIVAGSFMIAEKKIQHVVVYTDASTRNKVSAWSVLIKIKGTATSSPKPIILSGDCPEEVQTSSQAECFAILRAVESVKELYPDVNCISVNTDCQSLIRVLRKRGKRSKFPVNRKIQEDIIKSSWGCGIALNISHVPAHTGGKGKAARLNRKVDLESKRARKKVELKLASAPKVTVPVIIPPKKNKIENFFQSVFKVWKTLVNN